MKFGHTFGRIWPPQSLRVPQWLSDPKSYRFTIVRKTMPNHKVKICGLYLYKAYPHWKGDLLQISHKNKAFEPLLQPENSMKTRIFKRFRKDFHQFCFFSSVRYQISAIYDQCFGISSSQEFGLWYRSSSARTECAGESFREPFCATLFWQRSRCFDGFSGLIFWGPKLPCQRRTRTLRDQLLHSHQHFLNEMVLFICQCDNSLQPIQIYVVQSCQRCIQCIFLNWHTFNVKLQIEPSAFLKSKALQRESNIIDLFASTIKLQVSKLPKKNRIGHFRLCFFPMKAGQVGRLMWHHPQVLPDLAAIRIRRSAFGLSPRLRGGCP